MTEIRRLEASTPKGKLKAKAESQTLVAANPARVELIITNAGASPVYLALGGTAVAEEGIFLAKEGPPFTLDNYRGAVTVITKEGESLVTYAEI